jgi:ankyrin repeat protein
VIADPNEHTDRLVKYLMKAIPASLETKSFAGYTPLHLAFKLGRLSIAKILIDAGANQATRDTHANNLIHDAVSNLPADRNGKSVRIFGELLELLDPELRSNMFHQRNSSVTMTGATPLHAFIQQNYGSSYHSYEAEWVKQHVAIANMLLKYSKGEDLAIINGSGDLPLHTLITAKSRPMVRALLDFNPNQLATENAVGRTPFEIAQDQDLAEKFANPPAVSSVYHWNNNSHSEALVNRESATFLPGYKVDKRCKSEKMWHLVKKYHAKSPGTNRKLVSLNEANEVAKRLSEMTKKKSTGRNQSFRNNAEGNGNDDQEQGDEVSDWCNFARRWDEYGDEEANSMEIENEDQDIDMSD